MKRHLVALCLLVAGIVSCGDGGVIIVGGNFGTVTSDADCDGGGGHFDLRNAQGFVFLVVIDSDTTIILASGDFGACNDLVAGSDVEVLGSENLGSIDAREVRLR